VPDKDRSENLATGNNEKLKKKLNKLFIDVEQGYDSQSTRASDILDYWRLYNGELGTNQLYSGRNRLFIPIVYEALQARSTRFCNSLFPLPRRHIEAVSDDGTIPRAAIAIGEHYINDMDIRSVLKSLFISGDIEGQWNIYVEWKTGNRVITSRTNKSIEYSGTKVGKAIDVLEEEEPLSTPCVEILSDIDICILPHTSSSIRDALSSGGAAAIVRRWSKQQIKDKIESGDIDKKEGEKLLFQLSSLHSLRKDSSKAAIHSAGVKKDGRGEWVQVYEIWTELELDGDMRLCQIFMTGTSNVLMCRRNPLWCDVCPLLSAPSRKVYGTVKGVSIVQQVRRLQYFANDVLNEAADSANYSLLPITYRDPAYITAPLILSPGAIWNVPPNSIQFAEMPPVWQHAMEVLTAIKAEIFQVLSVNPSMIPQSVSKKPTQAQIVQEQQVDLLMSEDVSRAMEELILTPFINLVMDLDYQYRDNEIVVRNFGEMGMQANLQKIPPFQTRTRYNFYWVGTEAAKSIQQVQQKIAMLNVLRTIPEQAYQGYKFDPAPILLDIVETVFGPRLGRLAFSDTREQMTIQPDQENELMDIGQFTPVHPMDNVVEHIQSHTTSLQQDGDPFGMKAPHIQSHKNLEMEKQKLMMMQQAMAQQSGGRTAPRPGAQPGRPRTAQQPPGAVPSQPMQRMPGMTPNGGMQS
jgi:hypothetical protein